MIPSILNNLFEVSAKNFCKLAVQAFQFQYAENEVYQSFCKALNIDCNKISTIQEIPFLPISLYKSHKIVSTPFVSATIFESSGTSQTIPSRHYVRSLSLYQHSFLKGFIHSYGKPEDWCFLGLLPSYIEKGNSSLVYMVQGLMNKSRHPSNGFFLNNYEELYKTLLQLETDGQRTMLFGVTYALLNFAAQYSFPCSTTTIMETGGMKGRRKELTRDEVHHELKKSFGVKEIHSEYGMTELLSQAYSLGDGIFNCPPWMKVLVRDDDDPMHIILKGKGAINIIDLANIYSCCFIATDDVGEVFDDGSFKILGRMDNSDVRGCSLLAL